MQPSRAKAVHPVRQLTNKTQSCAYMYAAQQSKSCASSQAAYQQNTKLCIQAGS